MEIFAHASGATQADAKAISGCITKYMGAAVAYRSARQPIICLSSTGYELVAATMAAQQALYCKQILDFLRGEEMTEPINLYEDNKGCYHLMTRRVALKLTKAMHKRWLWVRELAEHHSIRPLLISTNHQQADINTKPVTGTRFYRLTRLAMGYLRDPTPVVPVV